MAEYAGYVAAPNQFDWGKFSSELASNKISIAEAARAERAKKKEAFEKTTQKNYDEIKEPVKGYNQTTNDFFTQGTVAARDMVAEVYKKADYNFTNTPQLTRVQTNAKNYIAGLGETAKGVKENQEKLIDPKFQESQSDIGRNFSKLYVLTSDVRDKKNFFDNDGNGYVMQVDAKGNPVSNVKINPTLLKSTQGWTDGSIDYDKQLNDFVGNQVGESQKAIMLGTGAIQTTKSIKDNPLFKDAKAKLVTSLTANDKETARFLTSVGGYASYIEGDLKQKEQLLSQGLPEEKLIPIGLDENGLPTAKLSQKQRIDATTLADAKIQQRVDVMETLTKPASSGSGGSQPKPTEGSKARKSAINEAIALREKAGTNPYDGYVISKIKNAFKSEGPVDVVPLMDSETGTKLIGYDVFRLKDGKRQVLPKGEAASPKGALFRMPAGAQGFFEILNKNQKRGEEFVSWGTALDEYRESGGDMSRVSPEVEISTPGYGKKTTAPKEAKPASKGKIVTMATIRETLKKQKVDLTTQNIEAYKKQLIAQGYTPE